MSEKPAVAGVLRSSDSGSDEEAPVTVHQTPQSIAAALEEVFDMGVQFHGFTRYLRDYDVVLEATADPRAGIPTQYLRYRFRHCVHAAVTTSVGWDVWRRSLDDRLLDDRSSADLDGYVWGVEWQENYPGMKLVHESPAASEWSERIGIPMFEMHAELNAHEIRLVFSGLEVRELESGWTPYSVGDAP